MFTTTWSISNCCGRTLFQIKACQKSFISSVSTLDSWETAMISLLGSLWVCCEWAFVGPTFWGWAGVSQIPCREWMAWSNFNRDINQSKFFVSSWWLLMKRAFNLRTFALFLSGFVAFFSVNPNDYLITNNCQPQTWMRFCASYWFPLQIRNGRTHPFGATEML